MTKDAAATRGLAVTGSDLDYQDGPALATATRRRIFDDGHARLEPEGSSNPQMSISDEK